MQSLSVITACIPYIKNVLIALESGMFQTGHFHLATIRNGSIRSDGRHPTRTESVTAIETGVSNDTTKDKISHDIESSEGIQANPFLAQNTATAEPVAPNEEWDGDSQSSQARIIKQTLGWQVNYEAS